MLTLSLEVVVIYLFSHIFRFGITSFAISVYALFVVIRDVTHPNILLMEFAASSNACS